jgi:EAL domain-containing protein (putative c-di-GMP-specific phosphodiesterase class I)/CRP-like cAMP-binding protein
MLTFLSVWLAYYSLKECVQGGTVSSSKRTFSKGDILLREGEIGHNAYLLESGSVEILVQRDDTLIQIGTRGAGSIIGEMAMIDEKPRTATIRALEECHVIEISREDFSRRLDSADPILKMVMRVIMTRYRDMMSRVQMTPLPGLSTLAVENLEKSSEFHKTALTSIKLHHELKSALEKKELALHFQPIISLQEMKICGFEALMRWNHPGRGPISPSVFIPVAEESDLISELSSWALSVSCDAIKELRKAADKKLVGREQLFMSVNFSVKDFSNGSFFDKVQATLRNKEMEPRQIHLEITESLLMEAPGPAKQALDACSNARIPVSIDDFGTGYSSLSYLHFFPIDTLKIDQSFIRSMFGDPSSKVLVKSIIGLAHNMGIKVIAEGIEHEREAILLKELGCEEAQGYWFAKPLPLEDAIKFVQSWKPPKLG